MKEIAEMDQKEIRCQETQKVSELGLDQLDVHYIFLEDNETFETHMKS